MMPALLRDCDAALFPNRCEGGTNLVAMEAMACGVPSLIADNTGQHDLVTHLGAKPLTHQTNCPTPPEPHATTTGWGERSVEECVASLEKIYHDHQTTKAQALQIAERLKAWNWHAQNQKLLSAISAAT